MARTRSLDYDDRRQVILDQAAKLFAEKGFARTSISELSKACNASKAWIYHYYDSKEAILFELLEDHIRLLLTEAKNAVAATEGPKAQLEAFIRAVIGVYRGANEKHAVLLNDLAVLPEDERAIVMDLERQIVDLLVEVLAAVNPAIGTDKRLRKPVAMSVLGTLNWTYTWFRDDGPLDFDAYAKLLTDLFLGGVGAVSLEPPPA